MAVRTTSSDDHAARPQVPRQRLRREDRLRRRAEFLAVQQRGVRLAAGKNFLLLGGQGPAESPPRRGPRLGITVSAKVGNAVLRNRIKRCVREVFRRSPDRARLTGDLVVLARPSAAQVDGPVWRAELIGLLARARGRR